ncbi:putative fatty-acid--CoA ligase fadD21 [Rubripirellula tenax]|uniref:Putative fatty-acid--CoA ligase fadD21 n=1 Tax=Rubripirellula tenax TaxID=2528015 RepID=A0A5C6FA95_9BACT|nr:AMP-binding protein [Rubripirellula tenax]TWU56509.1 putative fatty-acid--CoA ligase fadD21 [Rubripirellula tenax]
MAHSERLTATTLVQWIGMRAKLHGDRPALTFLDDETGETTWSYAELWRQCCAVASQLNGIEVAKDDTLPPRAMLLYSPGVDFLAGFLGCQVAGWIPVPTCYPKPNRAMPRLDSVAADCAPSAILGDRYAIDGLDSNKLAPPARSIPRIITSENATIPDGWIDPQTLSSDADAIAFLQYTSGSTSDAKGVVVRHRNVLANLESIRRGFQIEWPSDIDESTDTPNVCGVFWLPFFHDMGLIGGVLAPLYVGGRTILMSPRSFLQRPIRWLQAISKHNATISGAPNFAYQLCVDRISPDQTDELDLSGWRIAFSGAEPVQARTLLDFGSRFSSCGFASNVFYPCYGLAEATLLAAGGDGPAEPTVVTVERESLATGNPRIVPGGRGIGFQKLVACGSACYQTELKIVDPSSRRELSDSSIGEIWIRGQGVTSGHWNRDAENAAMFDAETDDGQRGFCRTGDLGFLHQSQLYITGRLKDLIILRGRNLFPQDIESTALDVVGQSGIQCAAFPVDSGRGEALAIVVEVPRDAEVSTLPDLVRSIRREVIEVHEVDPRHVWLVRPATIPMTSSGKVQRSRCREQFVADDINTKYRYDRCSGSEQVPIPLPLMPANATAKDFQVVLSETENWMTQWLIARAGVDPADIDTAKPFSEYGLDSMTAVEMSGEIEDWSGVELTPMVAWNHPTVSGLSDFIAHEITASTATPIPSVVSDAHLT